MAQFPNSPHMFHEALSFSIVLYFITRIIKITIIAFSLSSDEDLQTFNEPRYYRGIFMCKIGSQWCGSTVTHIPIFVLFYPVDLLVLFISNVFETMHRCHNISNFISDLFLVLLYLFLCYNLVTYTCCVLRIWISLSVWKASAVMIWLSQSLHMCASLHANIRIFSDSKKNLLLSIFCSIFWLLFMRMLSIVEIPSEIISRVIRKVKIGKYFWLSRRLLYFETKKSRAVAEDWRYTFQKTCMILGGILSHN